MWASINGNKKEIEKLPGGDECRDRECEIQASATQVSTMEI